MADNRVLKGKLRQLTQLPSETPVEEVHRLLADVLGVQAGSEAERDLLYEMKVHPVQADIVCILVQTNRYPWREITPEVSRTLLDATARFQESSDWLDAIRRVARYLVVEKGETPVVAPGPDATYPNDADTETMLVGSILGQHGYAAAPMFLGGYREQGLMLGIRSLMRQGERMGYFMRLAMNDPVVSELRKNLALSGATEVLREENLVTSEQLAPFLEQAGLEPTLQ